MADVGDYDKESEEFSHRLLEGAGGRARYEQTHAEAKDMLADAFQHEKLFALFVTTEVAGGVQTTMKAGGNPEGGDEVAALFAVSMLQAATRMCESMGLDPREEMGR